MPEEQPVISTARELIDRERTSQLARRGRVPHRRMRRLTTASALAIAATAAVAAPAVAAPPIPIPPSKPSVNMEKVLLAAQWDPRKTGEQITPGAKASVKIVERRLAKKGYLGKSLVDGHFGSSTVSAYAAWQRHLGYSGLGATGLPGPTSLKKLLGKKFFLYNIVHIGKHVSYSDETVNLRTRRMLRAAGRRVAKGCQLDIPQGSYTPGASTRPPAPMTAAARPTSTSATCA